jgi:O-succinylbenzoic acid--coA ligase family protein
MTLEQFLSEWHSKDPTLLVHTSGSTGLPKPLRVEKTRMLNSAHITCNFLNLHPNDTALLCMPLDYIAGKMVVVRSIERKLQLLNVKPSGHPLSDASLAQLSNPDTPITFAAMVPLQVFNTLQNSKECERLKRIRHLIIGGGSIDDNLSAQLKNFPNAVWSTYGMTETLSHIALRRLNGNERSDWYTPFDSVKVSLNSNGCLVIDAPAVCAQRLETNDIAELRQSDDGKRTEFRILGRKDNTINTGGIKVQMEEVEKALHTYIVTPFLITKRKNKKFGEEIVLLTEANDLEEIRKICMKVLPRYWQPAHYQHINRLPITETGKIARAKALQMVDTNL